MSCKELFKTGDEIRRMKLEEKFVWKTVLCFKSGSGFTAGKMYRRNTKNDAWIEL